MGFQEVADLDCNVTTAIGGKDKKTGKANPTSIEGYFIGTKQVSSPKSKTGLAALHVLQTKKGSVGVWGKTNLDQKMKAVEPGQLIRVTFVGMQDTKNNPMYKYKVEVDADNRIDVGAADDAAAGGEAGTDYASGNETDTDQGYTEEYADDETEEEAAADEVTPERAAPPRARPAAAAPDAARQAKVQALLNGRGRRAAS